MMIGTMMMITMTEMMIGTETGTIPMIMAIVTTGIMVTMIVMPGTTVITMMIAIMMIPVMTIITAGK
jgi:hypothetical protein